MGRQAPFWPSLRSPMTRTSSFIRLLRSGSVRIALSYALVFIVSTLLLVGYLWYQTTNYLERETDAVIVADTRAIGDRLRDFGLPGALDAINDRLKRAADEHAIYLLTDPLMTPVGGNLSAWPAQVGRDPGWYEIKIVQDGKLRATRVLNVDLPADFHLLVGRDIQDRAAIRDVILNGLAWAAFAALVLAVAGGIMVRRAVFKRVETINRTAAAIVQGDLARRVPTTHSADEFDQLSGTINEMLDQIQLLIEGTRGASDAAWPMICARPWPRCAGGSRPCCAAARPPIRPSRRWARPSGTSTGSSPCSMRCCGWPISAPASGAPASATSSSTGSSPRWRSSTSPWRRRNP